jgi:hypothetical protein
MNELFKFAEFFYKVSRSIEAIPISFPQKEWKELKQRLADDDEIITTRVSDEFDKYKPKDVCVTEWGQLLRVKKVKSYDKISKHPFAKELGKKEKDIISGYDEFDVVYLETYSP